MAYLALDEFKSELGSRVNPPGIYEQITDRVSAKVADDAIGQALVDYGNAAVSQKLSKRYAVPIDTTGRPELAAWLRDAALIIATHKGWSKHQARSKNRETAKTAFDDKIRELERIGDGAGSLPESDGLAVATAVGLTGEAFGQDPVFGGDALREF